MEKTKLISCLLALGISAAANAGESRIKTEVVGAEAKIDVKGKHVDPIRGYGATFGLETEVSDGLALGGRVGFLKYTDRKAANALTFDDTFAGVYATYDLLNVGAFSMYVLGGADYHTIDFKDQNRYGLRLSAADAYLWNYNSGIGGKVKISDSVSLGVEYRYSDTLERKDTKAEVSNASTSLKGELKDLSLQSQQLAISMSYLF